MHRVLTALLMCAAAHAATVSVNISVSATIPLTALGGTSFTGTGTGTLTGGIADSGTFSATVTVGTTGSYTGPYTLTLKNGTLGGTLSFPPSVLTGSGSGTMTITSATGSYAGDSAPSFTVSGTGSIGAGGIGLAFSASNVTVTTGGTVTAPPPTISAVLDAGSYTSTIAPGSIFVVKGTNMSDNGYFPQGFPLPTSVGANKTTITFTAVNSQSPVLAYIIYTYLQNGVNQLAAVLPSTVVAGNYNVVVGYNGVNSGTFQVAVATTKFGVITQDSTGTGLASAQILPSYALDRLTTGNVSGYQYGIQPAHPGDSIVVYGTGMGAVPGGDNVASAGYDFTQHGITVQAVLGGTTITALYGGRTPGAAGLDQVSFTIPSGFSATGCAVTLQIKVGSFTSPATTLSVAPGGASACVYPGLTTQQLQNLDQGGTYNNGSFSIEQISATVAGSSGLESLAGGSFSQVTGFQLGAATSSANFSSITSGSCTVITGTSGSTVAAGGGLTYLDAGAVSITAPGGTLNLQESGNVYSLLIGQSGLAPGQYSLNGAGGKDVQKFGPVSITLGQPLTITGGLPAAVTESSSLTLNWTGGTATDIVEIIGSASVSSGSGANIVITSTSFFCLTTAGPGTFTVPSSILTQLPKVTASNGQLGVYSSPTPVNFNASLTAGGTVASTFAALTGVGGQAAFQ